MLCCGLQIKRMPLERKKKRTGGLQKSFSMLRTVSETGYCHSEPIDHKHQRIPPNRKGAGECGVCDHLVTSNTLII